MPEFKTKEEYLQWKAEQDKKRPKTEQPAAMEQNSKQQRPSQQQQNEDEPLLFCPACMGQISQNDAVCAKCGAALQAQGPNGKKKSEGFDVVSFIKEKKIVVVAIAAGIAALLFAYYFVAFHLPYSQGYQAGLEKRLLDQRFKEQSRLLLEDDVYCSKRLETYSKQLTGFNGERYYKACLRGAVDGYSQ